MAADAASVRTDLVDERALVYRQTFTERAGRWRLTATYLADPARATVLTEDRLAALDRRHYDVYALYDPALANTRNDDTGRTEDGALVAADGAAASALAGSPRLAATSSGYCGTASDGWTDVLSDGRLDGRHPRAEAPGNLVQTARLRLDGGGRATLALGFGPDAGAALAAARGSLTAGFTATARGTATQRPPPATSRRPTSGRRR